MQRDGHGCFRRWDILAAYIYLCDRYQYGTRNYIYEKEAYIRWITIMQNQPNYKYTHYNSRVQKQRMVNAYNGIKTNGYDKLQPVIISKHHYLIDGLHRLAITLLLDVPIYIKTIDKPGDLGFTIQFYEKHLELVYVTQLKSAYEEIFNG